MAAKKSKTDKTKEVPKTEETPKAETAKAAKKDPKPKKTSALDAAAKAQVEAKVQELIDRELKPKHVKPPPEDARPVESPSLPYLKSNSIAWFLQVLLKSAFSHQLSASYSWFELCLFPTTA